MLYNTHASLNNKIDLPSRKFASKFKLSSKQICFRDLLSSDCANTASFRASRKELSTSNLLPRVREGYHGKYLFTTLFSNWYEGRIKGDKEFIELASQFCEEKYFFHRNQVFIEQDTYIFKCKDVHLDGKILKMWKITRDDEKIYESFLLNHEPCYLSWRIILFIFQIT